MTDKDILARLRKGESIDAIAEEFTKMLNDAKTKREQELKDAEETDRRVKAQKEELTAITNLINSYLEKYYTNAKPWKMNDVCQMISLREEIERKDLEKVINDEVDAIFDAVFKAPKHVDAVDPIKRFLNKYGL